MRKSNVETYLATRKYFTHWIYTRQRKDFNIARIEPRKKKSKLAPGTFYTVSLLIIKRDSDVIIAFANLITVIILLCHSSGIITL